MKRYCYAQTLHEPFYKEYVIVFKISSADDPLWNCYADNAAIVFNASNKECIIDYYPSYVYEPDEVYNNQIANELKRTGRV